MKHCRLILLLGLLLSGCAVQPPRPASTTCPFASCSTAAITDWKLQGRMSLTRGEQGWHAGLEWVNHADWYRLQVRGPLGQGAMQLDGNASGVRLTDAKGQIHHAESPEALLQQVTGWELPVSGLRYWIRGLPDPALRADETRDEQGRPRQLRQSGWTIDFQRYTTVDGISWPDRLRLEHDDLVLKLVIDQWQPEPGPAL